MGDERPLFIMAGNGPYANRGCEAIVRGTTRILREHFKDPRFICLTHFRGEDQFRKQCLDEIDRDITHLRAYNISKKRAFHFYWRPKTWSFSYRQFSNPDKLNYRIYRDILPYLDDAVGVLSIGGDNYSLDYGIPKVMTGLDDIILQKNKPLAIWGASIGPFKKNPDYERYMSRHLQDVTGIFVRESATVDYLKEIGVSKNVYPVMDPAFLMDPVKPEKIEDSVPIRKGAIGLNLSPLMARYVTCGNLNAWACMAASIINDVAKTTEMPIYLIPHVTNPSSNDYAFMQHALSFIKNRNENIVLIPPIYDAAETKWIISRMALFAGARMHSTIAALSSEVPTLCFGYSTKAIGINQDLFGHLDFLIRPSNLDAGTVTKKVTFMMNNRSSIKEDLIKKMPGAKKMALNAGIGLKQILKVS